MITLNIKTNFHVQFVDITEDIKRLIRDNNIKDAMCMVYSPHTTAGIFINENADPSVLHDIQHSFERIVPWHQDFFTHLEGNSAAHIKTVLTGNSVHLIVERGKLVLGTWQGIFFAEYDGPRNRKAFVKFIT